MSYCQTNEKRPPPPTLPAGPEGTPSQDPLAPTVPMTTSEASRPKSRPGQLKYTGTNPSPRRKRRSRRK